MATATKGNMNKDEILGGYPTSVEYAVRMRQWAIVREFINQPPSERSNIVRGAIDLAVKWWDEQSALALLDLYRHTFYDVCLAEYLRKEGFTNQVDRPPNGYVIDRYREYFIKPKESKWHDVVYSNTAEAMANLLLSLPEAGDCISSISEYQPAFPELKKKILLCILAHSNLEYVVSILLSLRADVRHKDIGEMYQKVIFELLRSSGGLDEAIKKVNDATGPAMKINRDMRMLLLRSLAIRRIQVTRDYDELSRVIQFPPVPEKVE